MEIVDKVDEAQAEQPKEELIDFEFGDLCVGCSCGHEEVFVPGIEGIQLPILAATNKHELVLVCAKCGHRLRLFFKQSENVEELKKKKEELKAFKERAKEEALSNKEMTGVSVVDNREDSVSEVENKENE